MTSADLLRAAGTTPAAIEHHYDLPEEFFAGWLGPDLVYSCGWWPEQPGGSLAEAQHAKIDYFAAQLGARGRRVLDVGCGWGALLDRWVRRHGAAGGVGLTLSRAQARRAQARAVPGVDYRVASWVDHEPDEPYDLLTCVEATEHFASDAVDADGKVEVYRAFFERAASWLRPGGRVGLQLICLDDVGHEGSRAGRGPLSELIRTEIFPESMPASLSELTLGWEPHFELDSFLDHHDHYQRTFRAWNLSFRSHLDRIRDLVDDRTVRTFQRYFAAGEACFRLREHSLYRVVLTRRPTPKLWRAPLRPSALAAGRASASPGASQTAVREHYDVSNDFYALWLDLSMMYTSGMWDGLREPALTVERDGRGGPVVSGERDRQDEAGLGGRDDLEAAQERKIDFFARGLRLPEAARVLDVGCGWGGALRRLVQAHGVAAAVGLTVSQAQAEHIALDPPPRTEVRLERWEDHHPVEPYDGIISFGAFEHFARDGATAPERVAAYRRFFAACFSWLPPGGRLGLETIANDGAPDTVAPRGRGPLGDFVLDLFPESLCPHLAEVVLGLEPWFQVEVLRSDGADFARTFRLWLVRFREQEEAAARLVGPDLVKRFRRYLAASEVQFRTRTITNYRFVLSRREQQRA